MVPWPGANSISRSASFSTGIALLDLRKNRRRRRLDFGGREGVISIESDFSLSLRSLLKILLCAFRIRCR